MSVGTRVFLTELSASIVETHGACHQHVDFRDPGFLASQLALVVSPEASRRYPFPLACFFPTKQTSAIGENVISSYERGPGRAPGPGPRPGPPAID